LLAARVRNLPQNRFQLQCRRLLESGSLLNQNTSARSISSIRSMDCPGELPEAVDKYTPQGRLPTEAEL
jgi:hypothetical protein